MYIRRFSHPTVVLAFRAVLFIIRYWTRRIVGKVDCVEVTSIISTRCTLNCRDCHNRIPDYRKSPHYAYDFPIGELLSDYKKLLSVTDEIYWLVLIGGEAFMHKDLPQIVDFLCSSPRVRRLLIITNGTVIPKTELLTVLVKHKKKVSISISNYGVLSKNRDSLLRLLHEHAIDANTEKRELTWVKTGEVKPYERSRKKIKAFYKSCPMKCNTYLHGKFFICDQAAHREDLGLTPDFKESIDVRNINRKSFRYAWFKFQKLPYFKACDYCGHHTADEFSSVPAAIQIEVKT